jgi:PAT family beta-lactamase induction signal transducer AmpG
MQEQQYTNPFYIFPLTMPAGLSQGFVTVALPYLLTQHGFSVAQAATVIAVGFSANIWRFIWGPIVDVSLSLKKWYWIGVALCTSTLLLLCFYPFNVKDQLLLIVIVFISQVAGTFSLLPVNGFMAKRIRENHKGSASGWYQAGTLMGVGIGGGAGLWLTTHYNIIVAGAALCIASVLFALVVMLIKDIAHEKGNTIAKELVSMGKDIFTMLKVPVTLLVIFMLLLPIGTGAAANLWSAIAKDWHTSTDVVALVTGILSGLVSAVGCVAGGFIIDRWGNWVGYLGSGIVCAAVTLAMAIMPLQPWGYIIGVLAYTFGIGLLNAAFTALILYAIGKRNVATKYSLIASLGNVPVVYMTAFDGWAHDKYNSEYMLVLEAAAGILAVLIGFIILKVMMKKKLVPAVIE